VHLISCCLLLLSVVPFFQPFLEAKESCVVGRVYCQLGNNLFQVATASALAWDNNAVATFPDLLVGKDNPSSSYNHIFFRCNTYSPKKISGNWQEPGFDYHPIPFKPNIQISGYFQSERYFRHHRKRLLELFAPHPDDLSYMQTEYQWLMDHPNTVGVQIRYYYYDDPTGVVHIQYGKDYLEKAMRHFPETALFVVSSNNLDFARENMPKWAKNVFYIEREPHFIDFFLLSFCKHNIITNSSFGWWGAWLNQNPNKIIVAPRLWVNPAAKDLPTHDLFPKSWIKVDAKWGSGSDPMSY